MPVTPTYPGVYVEELPSDVRTIVGVSTSVAAFVGYFSRGPQNTAVQVFNIGDFEREFGGLRSNSEASYGIRQFFLNGGSQAWVVRTADGTTASPATATLTAESGGNAMQVRAGRMVAGTSVDDPGIWGRQLRIDVDYDAQDPTTQFNLTVTEINSAGAVLRSEQHTNLSTAAGADFATNKVNENSNLIQITSLSSRPAQTGTTSGIGGPVAGADGDSLTVTHGAITKNLRISLGASPSLAQMADALEKEIRVQADADDPILAGATAEAVGGRLLVRAGRRGTGWEGATLTFAGAGVGNWRLGGASNVAVNVQQWPLSGGSDGSLPGGADLTGTFAAKTGMYALRDVDLFNILCIPRAADLSQAEMLNVYTDAATFCEDERAFLLLDVDANTKDVPDAKAWLNDANITNHAAVYFPRVQIADPLNEFRLRSVGTSGTMAGVYARTDSERGVWKAPAGLDATLRGVQGLDYYLADDENGVLNPLGINCMRQLPVYGRLAWGARTLEGADRQASQWKYVPIRRLALYIEESLYRGTHWAVFEPNDEPLWAQLRLNVGAFMQDLFRRGAFQGTSPRDAYLVKCDGETTIQNDIDKGIVNILVGFAPLKPAEFVIIQIKQLAGQIQT